MSLLSSIAAALANVSPLVQAIVNGITLVEAIAPNLPGVDKLKSVQAHVASALGTADDVTGTIEGVLAQLKTLGVVGSATAPASTGPLPG